MSCATLGTHRAKQLRRARASVESDDATYQGVGLFEKTIEVLYPKLLLLNWISLSPLQAVIKKWCEVHGRVRLGRVNVTWWLQREAHCESYLRVIPAGYYRAPVRLVGTAEVRHRHSFILTAVYPIAARSRTQKDGKSAVRVACDVYIIVICWSLGPGPSTVSRFAF